MKIAFLGTGLMGDPMAQRILRANYDLIVYNRTRSKLKSLEQKGAIVATSAAKAVEFADCIILMLADAPAIKDVLFNSKVKVSFRGKTVIQMGTIAPAESIAFQKMVQKKGGDYFECPVLGSILEVDAGKLILMVGGTQSQLERHTDILECFGPQPLLIGPVGRAAALKLCMNQLIASHMTAFSQSLSLVQKSGIDVDMFMQILRRSALYTPMFDKKLPRLLKHSYKEPNFSTRHMLKDIRLFIAAAQSQGINVTALKGVQKVLETTMKKGFSEVDYCALYEVISSSKKGRK